MYEYIKKEGADGPFFTFVTKHNLTYYVSFRKMEQENYPLDNLYSLDFYEIDNSKGSSDPNISSTIFDIINSQIANDDLLIIHYLCDPADKRHLCRKRLFSNWFSTFELKNWIKYDYDFDKADYNISFLYNSNVYDTELVEEEILLTLDTYERAKESS